MRPLIPIVFLTISLLNCKAQNQSNMEKRIEEAVTSIEKAAANRDVRQLEELLHKDYRVIANRFKGSENAVIISKESYLQMMKDEKVGGTNYNVNFKDIKVSGHTAIVDVLYSSETSSDMHKFLVLIQDENNNWKVVSDIPIVLE
ncbi:nuclear transport factor 2 family protein [Marinilongibacter aquaticus]|uniref:nuclear transport factor 2 family protein n=1 Tax=Marinilongibacter aquaticus TaxID=2975157 RepID=UPI0021BDC066|nr:nuclear transport factor 2 family protein [Marinilongibacter aquaticus]UBM59489.1 nuclear transport factor 2 family protein [Marinilongibacter aquaticus]